MKNLLTDDEEELLYETIEKERHNLLEQFANGSIEFGYPPKDIKNKEYLIEILDTIEMIKKGLDWALENHYESAVPDGFLNYTITLVSGKVNELGLAMNDVKTKPFYTINQARIKRNLPLWSSIFEKVENYILNVDSYSCDLNKNRKPRL